MIGVVETPLGFVCDVDSDGDSDVLTLARERGLEVSIATGPWRSSARDRVRVRARRSPAPGHRDHRAAGLALGLFTSRPDGTLAWTAAGRVALDALVALIPDLVAAPVPELSPGWLLDEDSFTRLEDDVDDVARTTELATRLASALGLGPVRVRARPNANTDEVELRADDRLGRSWAIARLPGSLLAPARALAIALEHLDGALPTWLAPEQVRILPIGGDPALAAARALAGDLARGGTRVGVDADGPLAGRVGAATAARVPYLAFIGPAEAADRTVRVRARGGPASVLTSWSALHEHMTDERHLRRPAPVLPSQSSGTTERRGAISFQRVKKERLPSANR